MTTVTTTAWPTVTGLPGSPPAVFENPDLPHQPRIGVSSGMLWISCNCLPYGRHIYVHEDGAALPAHLAMAAYRQWHTDHGEQVRP